MVNGHMHASTVEDIHSMIHTGEKRHDCMTDSSICDKELPQAGDLNTHVRTHTWKKPCTCKMCPDRFHVKSTHILTHGMKLVYAMFVTSLKEDIEDKPLDIYN